MLSFRVTSILVLYSMCTFGQPYPATKIYPGLSAYIFADGYPNEQGYQFVARTHLYVSDTFVPPGLLVQLDHHGYLMHIDTLRNYRYNYAYKLDSVFLFSAYHYNKYPDTIATWVFEICDLHGKVLYSSSHDMVSCFPGWAGVAELNDSIYIAAQYLDCFSSVHESVYHYINKHNLEVITSIKSGGFLGNLLKIDDQPRFLNWLVQDIWIMDTTFRAENKIFTDTLTPFQGGTILPREDKPGWFGFGGCSSPSNYYEVCMIALDDQLKLDKVDVITHPPSNHWYVPGTNQTLCKQGDAYFVTGQWNVPDALGWWNNKTPTQVFIARYDLNLDRVWTKIVGGDRRYWPTEIHPTQQGGFMVAGGLVDVLDNLKIVPFTMYFDSDGEVVGTPEPAPGRYAFTIYGNPGREALRIMAEKGERKVLLQVVNAMGQPRLHRHLVEGMNEFDTAWWPSGTYLMSIMDEQGQVLWSQPWVRE